MRARSGSGRFTQSRGSYGGGVVARMLMALEPTRGVAGAELARAPGVLRREAGPERGVLAGLAQVPALTASAPVGVGHAALQRAVEAGLHVWAHIHAL